MDVSGSQGGWRSRTIRGRRVTIVRGAFTSSECVVVVVQWRPWSRPTSGQHCAAQSRLAFQDGSGFYACFVPPTADFSERELRVARVLCERAYRGAFIEPGFTRAYVCTGLG